MVEVLISRPDKKLVEVEVEVDLQVEDELAVEVESQKWSKY